MPVNWNQIGSQIKSLKIATEGLEDEDKNVFRLFTRKEFYIACGFGSTNALSNRFPDILAYIEEHSPELIPLGIQYRDGGEYHYNLTEIYAIIEACRALRSQTKRSVNQVVKPFRLKKPHIISVVNQKGGAGKSTCSLAVATYQAIKDYAGARVLLVDYDPQGNIQKFMDGRYLNLDTTKTLFKYLMGEYEDDYSNEEEKQSFLFDSIIRKSCIPNLDYCPALTTDNILEGFMISRENSLEDEKYSGVDIYTILYEEFIKYVEGSYDFIIFDCSPVNNTFIKTAMYSSDHIIVPAPTKSMDYDSTLNFIENVGEFFAFMKDVDHGHLGTTKQFDVLRCMYDGSDSSKVISSSYNNVFGVDCFPHSISVRQGYNQLSLNNMSVYGLSNSDRDVSTIKYIQDEWNQFNDHVRKVAIREDNK